ncbi:MAG TPA: OmpA family protein [Candidatus Aquabacterium excrementipullorum]|nr:OmpA family protein [Candidatus Aquabacterium excrementipullorum]
MNRPQTPESHAARRILAACLLTAALGASPAWAQDAAAPADTGAAAAPLDVGTSVPDAASVKEGLFPEDACKELEANGFKCMGFKPAIKYSLPASSFALGSAVLPELLKRQLDVFAEVLRGKRGSSGRQVKIVGHADASGSQAGNLSLSQRRAESVRNYLVQKGADASMLEAVGLGSADPKNKADPYSSENRRVEIGRAK